MISTFLQGSTQYDALGHVWYDGQLYNGYDAETMIGGMTKASVQPIAERSAVGRGILPIRSGFVETFYEQGSEAFYEDFIEPGLTYSPELVRWFQEMEIPNLVTDTIANELTVDAGNSVVLPLHCALMRNLGIAFTEPCNFAGLAEDCAEDRQWDFLYTAAPLNVVNGSGAPVNPLVIK